jgi:thiamine biosynthesis protein ThiS
MNVCVNGRDTAVRSGATVAELIDTLGLGSKRVAVELNRDVVARDDWQHTELRESDRVEIVQFVGGG